MLGGEPVVDGHDDGAGSGTFVFTPDMRFADALVARGMQGPYTQSYMPLGNLYLTFEHGDVVQQPRRAHGRVDAELLREVAEGAAHAVLLAQDVDGLPRAVGVGVAERDGAGVGLLERGDRAHQRGLAGAVGPEQAVHAAADVERDVPEGVDAVNLRGAPKQQAVLGAAGTSPLFGSGLLETAPTWDDLAWLVQNSPLPVWVKGVMRPRDAQRALDTGVAGIVVSNHGGRTLDGVPASVDVLAQVCQVVQGRVPVLMDGGIRRGTDVLKALALGATAVMIGRPYIYGLAAAGAAGVAHVLHILRAELEVAMALTGCNTLADIGPELLYRS